MTTNEVMAELEKALERFNGQNAETFNAGKNYADYREVSVPIVLVWEVLQALKIEAGGNIRKGQKWRYINPVSSEFFTTGEVYEIKTSQDRDGWFMMEDDTANLPHHWPNDTAFHEKFELVIER
jgi:hypothetical protein